MNITVYTDGAAIPNPGHGGWSAVFVVDGEVKKVIGGHQDHATNQQMEVTAALEALRSFTRPAEIRIISDSEYLVKSMNEWIPRRGVQGYANQALFTDLLAECQRLERVTFQWVRGHNGDAGNEQADLLARQHALAGILCPKCGLALDPATIALNWQKRTVVCGSCETTFNMSELK
jgi:ribonuclease HI